jgi:hypothetical protein
MGAQALATDVKRTLEWVTRIRWEPSHSSTSLIYLDSDTPNPVRVFCQTSSAGSPDVGVGMWDSKSFLSMNANSPDAVRRKLALVVWGLLLEAGYSEVRPLEDILQDWLVDYYRDLADGLRWKKGRDRSSVTLGGDLVMDWWWRGFPSSGYPQAELHFTQENTSGDYRRKTSIDSDTCPHEAIMLAATYAVHHGERS